MQKIFVQVGVSAMRTPSGEFLPSTPIYMEVEHLEKNGLTQFESEALTNVAGFFVERIKKKNKKELVNENNNLQS